MNKNDIEIYHKKAMVDTINNATAAIANNRRLWLEPEFQQLRNFSCKVTNSPQALPPPATQNHPPSNASNEMQLSRYVIQNS